MKQKKLRIAVRGTSELGEQLEACSSCIAALAQKLRENPLGVTVQWVKADEHLQRASD